MNSMHSLFPMMLFASQIALATPMESTQFELTSSVKQKGGQTTLELNRVGLSGVHKFDSATEFHLALGLNNEELVEKAFVNFHKYGFSFRMGKDLLKVGGIDAQKDDYAWLFRSFIERFHSPFLRYEPLMMVSYQGPLTIHLQAVNDLSNSLERPGYFSNQTQPALLTEMTYLNGSSEFLVQWGLFDLVRSQSGSLGYRYAMNEYEVTASINAIHRAVKYQHVIKYYDIGESVFKLFVPVDDGYRIGLKLSFLEVAQPDYPERSLSNRGFNQTDRFDDNGRSLQIMLERKHGPGFRSFFAYGVEAGRSKTGINSERVSSLGLSFQSMP